MIYENPMRPLDIFGFAAFKHLLQEEEKIGLIRIEGIITFSLTMVL
jgi:hypothetical protein